VDRVVETFGPDTIEQSMRASALHGHIILLITRSPTKAAIEISGGAWASSLTTIRRVFVGSRASFEAMNRAIDAARLRPVIDVDRYVAFWNEPDANRRRQELTELWAEDATFLSATSEQHGWVGIEAEALETYVACGAKGFVIRSTNAAEATTT
jgi:hypothetical protein